MIARRRDGQGDLRRLDLGGRVLGRAFHFVTAGVGAALELARAAAGDRDVSVAGGAATVAQFLAAGLIDELRVHIVPLVAGAGIRPFEGVPPRRMEIASVRAASTVTHVTYRLPR